MSFLRLKTPIYIIKTYIWNVIISFSNKKTILKLLKLKITSKYLLQPYFFEIKSNLVGKNIRPKSNTTRPLLFFGTNFNICKKRVLQNLLYLLTTSGIRLRGTSNINKKIYKIKQPY